MSKLALLGGEKLINSKPAESLFKWPIITQEDIDAVVDVVKNNRFSFTEITEQFQVEFAEWIGRKHALAFTNGTMSLSAAMFAIGLGMGDEIICPTKTYWGSISQASCFGASAVFCNINDKLSMDPDDLERCITPRTKAIMVVHYMAYPCDMDRIMEIANKHNLYVIEDVSHAQGSKYKGKKCGTFGHIAAMSLMSTKSFAAGELGILVTDDRKLYERALAYGHYERNNANYITDSEDLKNYFHIALGGVKGRANQTSTALARVQLKYYDERCEKIRAAMNYFYDQIEKIPGLSPIRVDESDGSCMGGFYSPMISYYPEYFGGLSSKRFCQAITAECDGTFTCWEGANYNLHTHDYFKTFDFFGIGKPSRIAFNDRDVREDDKALAPSDNLYNVSAPWFKNLDKEWIDKFVEVYKKVAENYKDLLEGDDDKIQGGRWHGAENAENQQKKK